MVESEVDRRGTTAGRVLARGKDEVGVQVCGSVWRRGSWDSNSQRRGSRCEYKPEEVVVVAEAQMTALGTMESK